MDGEMRIMTCQEIRRFLIRLSQKFLEKHRDLDNLGIIGIQRRGANLAFRISEIIGRERGKNIPVGTVDITFYRDDLSRISYHPTIRNTDITFPLDDRNILLVDDVIYTGRTVRAAIDALLDIGRPGKIELLVLIDRDHRELPIQPDYVGKKIMTSPRKIVEVKLKEVDGEEEVVIFEKNKR